RTRPDRRTGIHAEAVVIDAAPQALENGTYRLAIRLPAVAEFESLAVQPERVGEAVLRVGAEAGNQEAVGGAGGPRPEGRPGPPRHRRAPEVVHVGVDLHLHVLFAGIARYARHDELREPEVAVLVPIGAAGAEPEVEDRKLRDRAVDHHRTFVHSGGPHHDLGRSDAAGAEEDAVEALVPFETVRPRDRDRAARRFETRDLPFDDVHAVASHQRIERRARAVHGAREAAGAALAAVDALGRVAGARLERHPRDARVDRIRAFRGMRGHALPETRHPAQQAHRRTVRVV